MLGEIAGSEGEFQSTSLLRGTTFFIIIFRANIANFNPRPSCEGRLIM